MSEHAVEFEDKAITAARREGAITTLIGILLLGAGGLAALEIAVTKASLTPGNFAIAILAVTAVTFGVGAIVASLARYQKCSS